MFSLSRAKTRGACPWRIVRPMSRVTSLLLLVILAAAACSKSEPPAAPPPPKAVTPAADATTAAAVGTPVAGTPATGKKRVDIKVTMKGYEPSTIPLKTKEPVTLVFTRTEPTNCGSEIQIAALKWKKDLPMNTPVEVDFTPERAGEVVFACGMDMMHGILAVAD